MRTKLYEGTFFRVSTDGREEVTIEVCGPHGWKVFQAFVIEDGTNLCKLAMQFTAIEHEFKVSMTEAWKVLGEIAREHEQATEERSEYIEGVRACYYGER